MPPLALHGFLAATVAGNLLLAGRFLLKGELAHAYLPWNLFLAWIPMGLAWVTTRACQSRPPRTWIAALAGSAWLLFFPNAPYLVTDLIHVGALDTEAAALWWFDLMTHLLFGITGLMLGYLSLATVQNLVGRFFGSRASWGFACAVLLLAGFGIYLGRFQRWNSWDLVSSPVLLLADIAAPFAAPLTHLRVHGFSLLCGGLLILAYLMCHALGQSLSSLFTSPRKQAPAATRLPEPDATQHRVGNRHEPV
ncbi:MAG: DUF1361 domain-containing protein [Limisphaerales bacterium]